MDLKSLKRAVLEANLLLPQYGLVRFTWGNVSGIDRNRGIIVIKPSGVEYETMTTEDMAVVQLDGTQVDGPYAPSSDTATHLALYNAFPDVGGIVHTHSPWATIFAQSGTSIAPLGTTHADYFYGDIPCTRKMTKQEVQTNYEAETGKVIVEEFHSRNPMQIPAVLVHDHGPFAWGISPKEAVFHAVVLEEVAMMAWHCGVLLNGLQEPIDNDLLDRHYLRKHGKNAYYGQGK